MSSFGDNQSSFEQTMEKFAMTDSKFSKILVVVQKTQDSKQNAFQQNQYEKLKIL